jgi:hypothetical protein
VPIDVPGSVATAVPGLSAFCGAVLPELMLLAAAAIAVHLWVTAKHRFEGPLLLAGLVIALVPSGAEASPGEFLAGLGGSIAALAVAFALIRWVLGANPVAWVLAALALALKLAVLPLVAQPGAWYATNGWVALAVVIAAAAVWLARRGAAPVQ